MSAFARSAMNPKSPLCAATQPFAFGDFYYYESRNSCTVTQAEIRNYFPELRADLETAYYGLYFLELAEYYTREYNDETDMLKLLYQSLRALSSDAFDRRLVRRIYEWKTLVVNGEYPDPAELELGNTAQYTLQFITETPVEKLYTFTVSDAVLSEIEDAVGRTMKRVLDKPLKSEAIIEAL